MRRIGLIVRSHSTVELGQLVGTSSRPLPNLGGPATNAPQLQQRGEAGIQARLGVQVLQPPVAALGMQRFQAASAIGCLSKELPFSEGALDLARSVLSMAAKEQPALSPVQLLLRVPVHVRQHVFLAYCAWLIEKKSRGAERFEHLLRTAPKLDTWIFEHMQTAWPALAASWGEWCRNVANAMQDTATCESLALAFQQSFPCRSRRVLQY